MVLRLIVGDDPILVGEAISASVEELVGDGDRSLMLELLTETDYRNDDGDWESAKVLDAPEPRRSSRSDVSSSAVISAGSPARTTTARLSICSVSRSRPPTSSCLGSEASSRRSIACQHCPKRSRRRPNSQVPKFSRPRHRKAGAATGARSARGELAELRSRRKTAVEDLLGEDRSRVVGPSERWKVRSVRGGRDGRRHHDLWWRSGVDSAVGARRRNRQGRCCGARSVAAADPVCRFAVGSQWRSLPAARRAPQALQQHVAPRRCRCSRRQVCCGVARDEGQHVPGKKAMRQSRRLGTESSDERSTSWPMPTCRCAAPRIGHRSWWSRCSSLGWPTSAVA